MGFQIAIDGPSGSGKSTVARRLAKRLGFVYVDTGAMYRAVGLYCDTAGIEVNDETAVSGVLGEMDIKIEYSNEAQLIFLNGDDVTAAVRTPRAAVAAAAVAAHGAVRVKLVEIQRKLAKEADVVMDGRDICDYVLPEANVKVYLNASVEARVTRRCNELEQLGVKFDYEQIKKQIIERDVFDSNRKIAPLAVSKDAVEIDASELDVEGVVEAILVVARDRGFRKAEG